MSLLLALLNPDPKKRMSVIEASKHHWFINQKSKMNTCKKEKILPSLKTILELRDSGSFELASHRLLASGLSIGNTDSESDQEELMLLNTIDHDNVHRICREDSFLYMYMK
jgi:serine/threonine protein kinase